MDFGVGFLTNSIMVPFLDFFHGIVPSYGWAIVALTLAVRLALFPINANQLRNMRNMKIANPVMQKRIKDTQERYKTDPKRMQEEMSKIYQEFGNPLSGCLPALLQMPILFALFATLRGSPFADINYTVNLQIQPTATSQVSTSFTVAPQNVYFQDGVHYPIQVVIPEGNNLAVGQKAHIQLQTPTGEKFTDITSRFPDSKLAPQWKLTKGENLADVQPDGTIVALQPGEVGLQVTVPGLAAREGFLFIKALGKVGVTNPDGSINWDILIMVLGFGVSLYINQNISSANAPVKKSDDPQQQQQETVNKFTPVIFSGMFLFFPLPAGVLLYMLVANIFQTVQAFLISLEPLPENLQKIVDNNKVLVSASNATVTVKAKEVKEKQPLPFEPDRKSNKPNSKKKST
jgi:YidC/Oxa1 family membrane protein insertase